jgi:hypothetical protein
MSRKLKTHASGERTRRPTPPAQRDFVARAGRNVPVGICFPHPLSWWRTRRAQEFRHVDITIARAMLNRSAIVGEPHWHLGARGDKAVAIGVAVRVQRRSGNNQVLIDVAMTAVLCCALEGDLASALLLSGTLKRLAASCPHCEELSNSWLTETSENQRRCESVNHSENWRAALISRYPNLFGVIHHAKPILKCSWGWRDTLETALARIETAATDVGCVRIRRVRQENGALRIYWTGGRISDSIRFQIEEAVALALARSACTCEVCGREGRLHSRKGWLSTKCPAHATGAPIPIRPGLENLYIARSFGSSDAAATVSCRRYIRDIDAFVDVDPRPLGIEP